MQPSNRQKRSKDNGTTESHERQSQILSEQKFLYPPTFQIIEQQQLNMNRVNFLQEIMMHTQAFIHAFQIIGQNKANNLDYHGDKDDALHDQNNLCRDTT
jgi:hypothetical protein